MDLSICVISRSEENLSRLLESLPQALSGKETEILLSWNGEVAPQENSLFSIPWPVHIFRASYDFSANNNALAREATGDFLLFLNDDMAVDAGSLDRALETFRSRKCAILGANLRYENGLSQHAGVYFDSSGTPYHRLKGKVPADHALIDGVLAVPAVTGAFMLMRRDEFLELLFDERCLVAGQDILLCLLARERLGREICFDSQVTAIHYENLTRKLFDQKTTPQEDLALVQDAALKQEIESELFDNIRLRVVTEKPGWIMHRKGLEIARHLESSRINEDYPEANVHYYINYGRFNARPQKGLVVANFTHYDPSLHAEKWSNTAHQVDHCIAVSDEAADHLRSTGVADEKISTIIVGADQKFRPRMTIGVVGRVYPGGRKGEHLVHELLGDREIMDGLQIIAPNDSWGTPTWEHLKMDDFYRSIDFLLVPALIEGGPVPFMEALACGTLSIAPHVGVVPQFPHIPYERGDIESLKKVIQRLKAEHLSRKKQLSRWMEPYDWRAWALSHLNLFTKLLIGKIPLGKIK